jgi:hypothetical protein
MECMDFCLDFQRYPLGYTDNVQSVPTFGRIDRGPGIKKVEIISRKVAPNDIVVVVTVFVVLDGEMTG